MGQGLTSGKAGEPSCRPMVIAAEHDCTLCARDSRPLSDGRGGRCCADECAPVADFGLNESCTEGG
jgi:hypothetical protein